MQAGGRMRYNRRGFLRFMLAAPVAAVVAAGLWKPAPKPTTEVVPFGRFKIEDPIWSKIDPAGKDSFEAYITTYHSRLIVQRPRRGGKLTWMERYNGVR